MNTEELKNIAPKLSEIKSLEAGFKTPKGYFESVEDIVLFSIHQESEETMTVPDGYFDTIEEAVFTKLKKEPKVISLKDKIRKSFIPFAAAASILLLVTLQLFNTNNTTSDTLAEVATEDIEGWIDTGNVDISLYELALVYSDDDFNNLESTVEYSDDDLIYYLDDIDVESLILTN